MDKLHAWAVPAFLGYSFSACRLIRLPLVSALKFHSKSQFPRITIHEAESQIENLC